MARRVPLYQNPKWLEFATKYHTDLPRFAVEVCGASLSLQQYELLQSVQQHGSRTTVSSGTGTGKSFGIGVIALWHLTTAPHSHTMLTSADVAQIKAAAMKEIALALGRMRRGPYAFVAHEVEMLIESAYIKGYQQSAFIEIKTANAKNAQKMAGRHAQNLLIICDEAATVPDEVHDVIVGTATDPRNRIMLTSQMTKNSGFFWRTHNELCISRGGHWIALTFSSLDSPFVSVKSLEEKAGTYDESEWRVRVLGLGPEESATHFIGMRHMVEAYRRGRIIQPGESFGYIASLDIAGGMDGLRDKSALVIARVAGFGDNKRVEVIRVPIHSNKIKLPRLPDRVLGTIREYPQCTLVVDGHGIGLSVAQSLQEQPLFGNVLIKALWGQPCFQRKNKERFLNKRAQATFEMAKAIKEGRVSFLAREHQSTIMAQACSIPRGSSNGRIAVPEKGSEPWGGSPSPDILDALAFIFMENVHHVESEMEGGQDQGAMQDLFVLAGDAFAGA